MTKKRDDHEFRLSCAVADYLGFALPDHVQWTHFPAGEERTASAGKRLKRLGTKPGWPDYIVLPGGGQVLFIELKKPETDTPAGRLSPAQKAFKSWCAEHGYNHFVCQSTADVQAALECCGVQIKARVA